MEYDAYYREMFDAIIQCFGIPPHVYRGVEWRMTEHDAFLQSIVANPDDDAPRLIYADWLEEHDQPERAQFIRVQIELAKIGWAMHSRGIWADFWIPEPLRSLDRAAWTYHRGFIESVECTCQQWLDHGPAILQACPTIREVKISDYRPCVFSVDNPNVCGWIYGLLPDPPFDVPHEIWNYLRSNKDFADAVPICTYENQGEDSVQCDDAARKDLSQAALAYARERLPQLAVS